MKAKLHTLILATLASAAIFGAEPAAQGPSGANLHKSGDTMTVDLPGGATMEFVWCAPGTFEMGSPADEAGRFDDESRHAVTITRGFWIGKYEVTQRQWESVMHSNQSRFKGSDHPMENISWHDCEAFIHRVNAKLGGAMRLPTEAEWEYACRAGSDAPVSGGEKLPDVAWYDSNSGNRPHDVGRKPPNAWGIYDMHGNALEWCQDWYSVLSDDAVDPRGPSSGSFKVLRGGCWFFYERDCRCAYRLKREPNIRNCIFGFRLVCSGDAR